MRRSPIRELRIKVATLAQRRLPDVSVTRGINIGVWNHFVSPSFFQGSGGKLMISQRLGFRVNCIW